MAAIRRGGPATGCVGVRTTSGDLLLSIPIQSGERGEIFRGWGSVGVGGRVGGAGEVMAAGWAGLGGGLVGRGRSAKLGHGPVGGSFSLFFVSFLFFLFIFFSVLHHFKIFRHFLKMCLLHHN